MMDDVEELRDENGDVNDDDEAAAAAEELEKGIIGVLDSPKVSVDCMTKRQHLTIP